MQEGTKDFLKYKLPVLTLIFIAVSGAIAAGVYYFGA